ncbi:hypothetical protein CR513_35792, partial [Mucuna pruriens]
MKHKFKVCQIFVDFFLLVKNQFGKSIKRLWLNNGIEFVNLEFSKFLKDNGVVHELMCVNTSQQNEVTERKNHHLLKVARALLFQMSVPNVYWGETILTASYLINKLSIHVLNGISPINRMLSFFPSSPLLNLPNCVFRCVAFVHSHNPHRGKLDTRAFKYGESYLEVKPFIESLSFPTLKDDNWLQAMKEEMNALKKKFNLGDC